MKFWGVDMDVIEERMRQVTEAGEEAPEATTGRKPQQASKDSEDENFTE